MDKVLQHKVVAALPSPLEPDSIYYVRTGSGFDIHVTNGVGVVTAYSLNANLELDGKVDKELGYSLLPNTEITRLATIHTGATKNRADSENADKVHTHTMAQVTGLETALAGKASNTDPRFTDAREWTATTISQAEVEAGTATTRRAFTAQRLRQGITAWYTSISGAIGRTILGRGTAAEVRGDLGLGTAATKNVGTASGNVMEASSSGVTFPGFDVAKTLGWYFAIQIQDFAGAPEGAVGGYHVRVDGNNLFTLYQNSTGAPAKIYVGVASSNILPPAAWREVIHTGVLPVYAQRWPTFTEVTGKPATFTPSTHTHPVSQVTGLGAAATMDVGESTGQVMQVGAFGLGASGSPTVIADINNLNSTRIFRYNSASAGFPMGFGEGLYLHGTSQDSGYGNIILTSYSVSKYYIMRKTAGTWYTDELYHTGNTTKNPDGTLKASSPVINLYTDNHVLHNEEQFGADPAVTRKSKGVYEITGTLGLRSEGWYLDTPSDRNGNKYFNIEWTQNIAPDAVDGVVDEYRDDIVVTIETFERVWNKDTGLFENGTPIDINELQDRFVQLRFNEIKIEHEELMNENK